MAPSGSTYVESAIYRFRGPADDGYNPASNLLIDGDTLYGTTTNGGENHGEGTAFAVTAAVSGSGYTEKLLHTFLSHRKGVGPTNGLVAGPGGVFYGTTDTGERVARKAQPVAATCSV